MGIAFERAEELPIRIRFGHWLRERGQLPQDMNPEAATITIIETEWAGDEPGERMASYQIDALTVYTYGAYQFAEQSLFANFLQSQFPLPADGVRKDVNRWYNLVSFAKREALESLSRG